MKIPIATYRLQFHSQFGFAAALPLIEYLTSLGISDIYASPIFKSRKGSHHGYDVLDPLQINPELGGAQGFDELIARVQSKNLGWLQDIVPNHMAYDSENKMLMDVFENGPLSAYAHYFDVEFEHPYDNLKHRILAPFLGEFYGHCLDKKQIQLKFGEQGFFVQYFDWIFPLRIDSYLKLLTFDLQVLEEQLKGSESLAKLFEIIQRLKELADIQNPQERTQPIILLKSWLWSLYFSNSVIHDHIERVLQNLNVNDLDQLLNEQFFRLAFWKVGNEELNYRRFFTISGLMCLRTEREEVFEHTHRLIFQYMTEKKFTGLRVDHVDGLYDPAAYLRNLRQKTNNAYVVIEKILDIHEALPDSLTCEGTTGYDFLNFVNEVFVDSKNLKKMNQAFVALTDNDTPYQKLVLDKKQLFIGKHMAGDIDNLAQLLKRVLNRNRYGKDLTMYGLKRALVEIMAQFSVYRTYIADEQLTDVDKIYMKEALARARNSSPGSMYELDTIEKILLLNFDSDIRPEEKVDWLHFVKRFQQFTGPLMAKALEDTAFYIYNRLISLNEVGGNPAIFGIKLKEFHEFNLQRAEKWPHTMNATSTHDTKRGEDVRSRLNVLSEIPKEWVSVVRSWNKMNRSKKTALDHIKAPDKNDEYFIYQTLVGAFPFEESEMESFRPRMEGYIVKAMRESKVHTTWIKPDSEYEKACVQFVKEILSSDEKNKFLEVFKPFQKKIAYFGVLNSLSQTLLKVTSPGIPDFYQGSELWDLTLVDPDNRRPVDYRQRVEFLNEIKSRDKERATFISDLWQQKENGKIKLFLIYHALATRMKTKELFEKGRYIPLTVSGDREDHVVAFAREYKGQWSITAVPRFLTSLIQENELPLGEGVWIDTTMTLPADAPSRWKNVLTGEEFIFEKNVKIGTIMALFPCALLTNLP